MVPLIDKAVITKGLKSVGISIWIKPDNDFEINVVVVGKRRNKLSVISKKTINQIEELSKASLKNLPLYISIDGKGVIHKMVDNKYDGSIIDLLLPNANREDFVIQDLTINETRKIVSLMRKDKLEEVLRKISEMGLDILNIFLGPFSISGITSLLEPNSLICIPYYEIKLINRNIENFEKNLNSLPDYNIEIESEVLDSNFIIPFSNSIDHFIVNNFISLDYPQIKNQKDNFQYKRLFQLCGWGILVVFFSCLLINFFLFDFYRQKNQLLEAQIGSNKEVLIKIEKLKQLVKTREDLFKNNLVKTTPLFSFYSDRLAKDIPAGITLSRLCLFPLQKQLTGKEPFLFLSGLILVSGYTYDSNYLDKWIKILNNLSWIREVVITSYSDTETEYARFELEIQLNEPKK